MAEEEKCAFCDLKPKTEIYEENDLFILFDCPECGDPILVTKKHCVSVGFSEGLRIQSSLRHIGASKFGVGGFSIDTNNKECPGHFHWHVRKRGFAITDEV